MADRVDYRLDDFVLDVVGRKSLDVDVAQSIVSGELELTIEGASTLTLTLEDPDGKLIGSDVLSRWAWGDNYMDEGAWVRRGRPVDARLDGHPYRLVKVEKAGTQLTLTFEDRIATYLRRHKGSRKASRAKVTRAEFVKMLVDEVKAGGGIRLVCPELHKRQPIARAKEADRAEYDPGVPDDADLTVKGKKATREQLRNMERVLDVARRLKAGPKATLALVEACIVESLFRNLNYGDRDSLGILQVRAKLHGAKNARDVEWCAHRFLTKGFAGRGGAIALARRHKDWSAGKVAQAVQASAFPERYDQVRDEALEIIRAYEGGGGRPSRYYYKRYDFSRGKNETSWDAIGRLAEEVNWRRFVRSGALWFISEEDLFRQKARLTIREGHNGVDWIDFDLDMDARRPVAECRVQARADRWTALPGMVVIVKDAGPASGRWLVSSVRGSLFDSQREIVLRKPIPEKPEPRSELAQRAERDEDADSSSAGSGGSADPARRRALRAYSAAARLDAMKLPYRYGGGHDPVSFRMPKMPPRGLDCSGSVCWVLREAGMFDYGVAWTSGRLAAEWGKPGEGKYMTVWANKGHVFIEFKLPGKRGKRLDTSPYGDGSSGPRLRRTDRPKNGFTPRHWPGT